MKVLFCDVETTGVDINKHFITQIAAIKWSPGERSSAFTAHVKPNQWPHIEYPEDVAEKTGIPFEAIGEFHSEKHVLENFVTWLGIESINFNTKYIFVAYNSDFDWRFMKKFFKGNSAMSLFNKLFVPSYFDLFSYMYMHKMIHGMPTQLKLSQVADQMEIKYDKTKLHDALTDVKILKNLFVKLHNDKKLL